MTDPDTLHAAHNTVAALIHDKAMVDALWLMAHGHDDE